MVLLKLTPLRRNLIRRYSYDSFFKYIAYSSPVTSVQSAVIHAHDMFGTGSWALDIVAGAVLFRTFISLPLGTLQRTILTSHSVQTSRELSQFTMQLAQAVRNKEVSQDEASDLAKKKMKQVTSLKRLFDPQHKTFIKVAPLFITEIFLWLCYSISLRNTVSGMPFEEAKKASLEMRNQSIGWIMDLTDTDPTLLLPLITVISVFTSLRVSALAQCLREN